MRIFSRNNKTSHILVGSIAALAAFPTATMAADINKTTNFTGDAATFVGNGGNWGDNRLQIGNGASGITVIINSGTLRDGPTTGPNISLNILGTNNTVTFTGSSTQLIIDNTRNWGNGGTGNGSFHINGTGNTMNVLAGATFTAKGWNGFDGTNNRINIDGAGSIVNWSADDNDGFGNSSGNDVYASNRINITNGGTMYVSGNGLDNMTANTAGQYTISVDGAGGRSTLGFTYTKYNGANGGGIAHIFNGGAIETHAGHGADVSSYASSNDHSHLEKIFIDGGVISYKDATAVRMDESTAGAASAFTYAGNNAMRLNNSVSTDTGSYVLANNLGTKNYVRLEMINGTTSVARALTIDGDHGGSMLFDATNATVTNGVTLVGASVFTATGTASSLAGVVSGGGSFFKEGVGTLALSSAETYLGNTTINGGTLQLGNNTATGSLNPVSAIVNNGTFAFHRTNTLTQGVDFNSIISGTGGVSQLGSGTTVLNGANTYTGLTLVSAGTLSYGASDVIASGPVTVNGATAVLALGANQSDTVGTVTLDGGGNITGSGTSTLTSTGSLEMKSGSVSAILAGTGVALNKTTGGTVTLSGANTYLGSTTVSAGTLTGIGPSPFGAATGTFVVSNPNSGAGTAVVLNLSTIAPTITSGLSGTFATPSSGVNTATINNGGQLFTVNQTATSTFAGTIAGAGGFTLGSPSTAPLTLSGASTYTGATNINASTLTLLSTGSLGNTAINVASGSTFAVRPGTGIVLAGTTGAGTLGSSLTLNAGSAFTMSDNAIGTFNLQQNASFGSAGLVASVPGGTAPTLDFDIGNGTIDVFNVTKGVTTNLGVRGLLNFSALTGLTSLTIGDYIFMNALGGLGASAFTLTNPTLVVGTNAYNLSLANSSATMEKLTISLYTGNGAIQSFTPLTPGNPINARPGTTLSLSDTLTNSGVNNLAVSLASIGALSVTNLNSSNNQIANGAPGSVTGLINTGTIAGSRVWKITNSDGAAANITANISGTVNVYDLANAKYTGTTVAFGNLRRFASVGSKSVAIGNQTVSDASFQDLLNVSATTGNANVTATGFTGLVASANGIVTNSLIFFVNTATYGSLDSTPTLLLVSNHNGVSGLNDEAAAVVGTPGPITITGQVYSGLMIWNGASGNWNTDASWIDSQAAAVHAPPGLDAGFTNVDTATFGNTAGSVSVNLNGVSPSLSAITFNSTGSYTITGATGIKMDGLAPTITAAGTHIINAPLTLASNLAVTVSSNTLTISGAISQTATVTLTKFGAGTLVLGGTNTFTGATTLSAGTLSVGADANLGNANALVFNGGTLQVTGTALTSYAAGVIGSHAVTLTPNATVGFDIANVGNTFSVTQSLNQGAGGLTKAGAGTLVLVGTNGYTGQTTVNEGVLLVSGSITGSTTVVNSGGTLGGTGTAGSVTVSGGIIAPGDPSAPGGIGDMTVNGNVSFSGSSALNIQFDYDLPGKDLLNLTGTGILTISSGAVLNLSVSVSDAVTIAAPYIGTPLTIIDYADGGWTSTGPGNNVFAGMNDDQTFVAPSGFTYRISYDGTGGVSEVTLTLETIPEPGVAMSLLGGLGLLLSVRRRRA